MHFLVLLDHTLNTLKKVENICQFLFDGEYVSLTGWCQVNTFCCIFARKHFQKCCSSAAIVEVGILGENVKNYNAHFDAGNDEQMSQTQAVMKF